MRDPLGVMGIDYHWVSGERYRLGSYESVVPEDFVPFMGAGQEVHQPGGFGLLREEMDLWGEEEIGDLAVDDGIVLEDFP